MTCRAVTNKGVRCKRSVRINNLPVGFEDADGLCDLHFKLANGIRPPQAQRVRKLRESGGYVMLTSLGMQHTVARQILDAMPALEHEIMSGNPVQRMEAAQLVLTWRLVATGDPKVAMALERVTGFLRLQSELDGERAAQHRRDPQDAPEPLPVPRLEL